jgi:hypothetical protein
VLVFLLANLPLPIITYLNVVVTLRYLKVRHLERYKHVHPKQPGKLRLGWWLGNISMIFAFTPAVVEGTLFVQNRLWLISYVIAAALTITGLVLMRDGLGQELRVLKRRRRIKTRRKVDRLASDKL